MSVKEQVAELLGVVNDGTRRPAERLAAFEQADTLRKDMKVGWAKLGMDNADDLRKQLSDAVEAENALVGEGSNDGGDDFDQGEGPERAKAKLRGDIILALEGAPAGLLAQEIADLVSHDVGEVIAIIEDDAEIAKYPHDDGVRYGKVTAVPETASEEPAKKPARAKKEKPPKVVDPNRGVITKLTNELLMDASLTYADIVAAIKAKVPDAATTTRSVASVAAELRKKGVDVPIRRKEAKPKDDPKASSEAETEQPQDDAADDAGGAKDETDDTSGAPTE